MLWQPVGLIIVFNWILEWTSVPGDGGGIGFGGDSDGGDGGGRSGW